MHTKLTTASLTRATAFVTPEIEAQGPGIVVDLAEADRTLRRLRKERAADPDPQRRAELLPDVDAAEADVRRLRKEGNPANVSGDSLDVAAHEHIRVMVEKAPPFTQDQITSLRRIFQSSEEDQARGTGQCLHCKSTMRYDGKAKRWAGEDGSLLCDATAVNVRRHQR